jgi:hypothetical protein
MESLKIPFSGCEDQVGAGFVADETIKNTEDKGGQHSGRKTHQILVDSSHHPLLVPNPTQMLGRAIQGSRANQLAPLATPA